MGKFLVLYSAEADSLEMMSSMTPEQSAAGMALWQSWADACGPAIVDLGAPLGSGNHVDTASAAPSTTQVCGYTIMEAESLEAVTRMLEGHPHFHTPGNPTIDVLPYIAIPGM